MKASIKKAWVDELRYGGDRQGKGQLCTTEDGHHYYCCLGILWEVAGHEWVAEYSNWGIPVDPGEDSYIEDCEIPAQYLEEFELTRQEQAILIEMNDDEGKSFKEIADWIEENL